jgi:FkbM family methyltransferase
MLRGAGYAGPIVSFEPVESNFASLVQRTESDPLWSVQHLALGSREETRSIKVSRATDFSSFLPLTSFGARLPSGSETTHTEEVRVMPLERIFDDVLPRGSARPLLKTDTQGSDLSALRGAGTALARIKAVQVEMSVTPIYQDAPDFMETLGFLRGEGFVVTGLFPPMSEELRMIEFDCVMARLSEV